MQYSLFLKEAHPRLDHPFEKAMVLLHQVIEIFDLSQFTGI
jgi:hypothetical protein